MKTTVLKVEVTEPMAKLLQGLVDTGLYGHNQEEAARRILEAELRVKWPSGITQEFITGIRPC